MSKPILTEVVPSVSIRVYKKLENVGQFFLNFGHSAALFSLPHLEVDLLRSSNFYESGSGL